MALVYAFFYIIKPMTMGRSTKSGRNKETQSKAIESEDSHKSETTLKKLARELEQDITIDDELNEESLAKCNQQEQSPFFAKLPIEIRYLIYEYASSQYYEGDEYADTAYFYRPSHLARRKTSWYFLLTCRRIWLEANALPMLQAEHCFWYNRGAPDGRSKEWMAKLTPNNRKNFGHLHLFAQMYVIEPLTDEPGKLCRFFLPERIDLRQFQPRTLHITIRHTDWWHWERENPLMLKTRWVQALLNTPDLRNTQSLTLELETLDYKVDQLQSIVQRLERLGSKELTTHLVNGVPTTTKFVLDGEAKLSQWRGSPHFNNAIWPVYHGKRTLHYHVYTLTWSLQFPDHAPVRAAKLRRAPRIPSSEPNGSLESRHSSRIEEMSSPERVRAKGILQTWRAQGSLLNTTSE